MAKAPKRYTIDRYGILNPYGDVWTFQTFENPDAAQDHIKRFWQAQPGGAMPPDFAKFKVVPVTVVVTAHT